MTRASEVGGILGREHGCKHERKLHRHAVCAAAQRVLGSAWMLGEPDVDRLRSLLAVL
jgi:hypothetical protein